MNIKNNILVSVKLIIVGIVVFSVIYTIMLIGIGQIWSNKSQGSLIRYDNKVVGSKLIGQEFNESIYFKTRPSSINYSADKSGSANLAPNNPLLTRRVKEDLIEFNNKYGIKDKNIPANIVTESGSGLDPHISPEAAYLQVETVAKASGVDKDTIEKLIKEHTKNKLFGIYGQRRVNVVKLNLSLEEVINK